MRLYIAALIILTLSYFQITKNLQLSFYNFFSPVILFLRESTISIKEFGVILSNIDEIRKENTKLKGQVYELYDQLAGKDVLSLNNKENSILKDSFNSFDLLKNKKIVLKKIVYYDAFKSRLVLDNQEGTKIPVNSLVIVGNNLVGIVNNSGGGSVEVMLISSKDLIINTYIINSQDFKIKTVLDSESGDSLVINNVLATEDVKVGDLVVTANNNENILPDLVIGKVQRIEGISSQTFRKSYIQKNYDLNLSSIVGVIVNE